MYHIDRNRALQNGKHGAIRKNMQCLRNWLVSYSASQPCGHRELRNSSPKARIVDR